MFYSSFFFEFSVNQESDYLGNSLELGHLDILPECFLKLMFLSRVLWFLVITSVKDISGNGGFDEKISPLKNKYCTNGGFFPIVQFTLD